MNIRNSQSKLAFIINELQAKQSQLSVISSIEQRKGDKVEVNEINTNKQVALILDSHKVFRRFGSEKITLEARYNEDNSLLKINIYSLSPCKTNWSERDIILSCPSDFIYMLSNS